mgnify:CR=1 FL=1
MVMNAGEDAPAGQRIQPRVGVAASDENAPATSSISPSIAAALRCTAPMNAPGPPPTMPYRTFLFSGISISESLRLTVNAGGKG